MTNFKTLRRSGSFHICLIGIQLPGKEAQAKSHGERGDSPSSDEVILDIPSPATMDSLKTPVRSAEEPPSWERHSQPTELERY